ncbi:hypothetical protein [Rhodococcus sp. UNC363MFTsu5.1]|uniref:hypothetical protein n=1 Tax=Rhodococcus sp. UNC363MFTsu5.1 TaxID=1449069 RepID=UPI0006907507|nr:hypothetical protein [Rhodococcus sp. UNC363MFTsu5.1]
MTQDIVSQGSARGYSWEPFKPGNYVAKKHGAHSDRVIVPLAAEIANAVCQSRPDLQAPEMQPAVLAYARTEAQLEVLTAYVDQHGAFTETGEVSAAEKHRLRIDTQAANHRSRLGLDPLSKARLGKDIASTQLDLAQILTQQREDAEKASTTPPTLEGEN